ncbi:hypothetical protein AAFF_G00239460 [Aldrovandia affinis]|uniref:Uncharacterized protein n=1 Tax=Aldrovandia affinis TaxID=143900 RepID=A0AAD7RE18_9TELE|nr:hypothetical protein AAFF_G00239460 [Aldrovandia affinis]
MAIQRRMGKNREEESFSAVHTSPGELQSQADGSVEDIDTINDSAHASHSDSVPQNDSSAGQRSGSNRRAESVIKMPPARRIEADGKTYIELVPVKSLNERAAKTSDVQDQMAQATAIRGGGPVAGTELNREGMRYCAPPPWTIMQDNTFMMGRTPQHFPGEYVIAAVAQRDVYSGELMTSVPFPIKLYSHYPNSYGCPTILLSMPPPGPVPLPYNDPQMGFPHFHPSTVSYPPEPGPAQESHAFFLPPLSARSVGPQEELIFRHLPHPNLHKHREQWEGDQGNGSQHSYVNRMEDQ